MEFLKSFGGMDFESRDRKHSQMWLQHMNQSPMGLGEQLGTVFSLWGQLSL